MYSLNTAGQPVVAGTTITSSAFNTAMGDIATALTQSICVDGQTPITGNIPFSAFKATGLGPATAANDALTYAGAGNFAGMVGTTTNDSAVAGRIGEYVETIVSSIGPVSLTTGVAKDVATVSLTAGDWDVVGSLQTAPAGTTVTSSIQGALSSGAANTMPTFELQQINAVNATASTIASVGLPRTRFSLSATTTVRMIAQVAFSVSTLGACGFINARRVR